MGCAITVDRGCDDDGGDRSTASGDVVAAAVFPADLTSIGRARLMVRDALGPATDPAVGDIALLLVSELVTNAIVHAHSAPDVAVRVGDGWVRVEVSDSSTALPVMPPPGSRGDLRECGRGLLLVESFASDFGVSRGPDGKTVWFTLGNAPSSASRRGAREGARQTRGTRTLLAS